MVIHSIFLQWRILSTLIDIVQNLGSISLKRRSNKNFENLPNLALNPLWELKVQ